MVLMIDEEGSDVIYSTILDLGTVRRFSVGGPARRFSDSQGDGELLTPLSGLRKYGPYDSNTREPEVARSFQSVEFIGAYPEGNVKLLDGLISLFGYMENGYTEDRGTRRGQDITCGSFREIYRLSGCVFPIEAEALPYDVDDLGSFKKALASKAFAIRERGHVPMGIIAGKKHKSIHMEKDMYRSVKNSFNALDIPSQYVAGYETVEGGLGALYAVLAKAPLGYDLWNIGLAAYTKLGGLPWTVLQSGSPENNVDVAIGMRFARSAGEGKTSFCVGIASVLDRFGRLVGILPVPELAYDRDFATPVPSMTLSREGAERFVGRALEAVSADQRTRRIMQERDELAIALHRLGPFHAREVEGALAAVRSRLPEKKVRLAFVSLVNAETISAFGPDSDEGALEEGAGFVLSAESALLCTRPSKYRFASPIGVSLQNSGSPDCPFPDVVSACANVQSLCGLHWQTIATGALRLPAHMEFALDVAQRLASGTAPARDSPLWRTLWFA